jgi:hypothetical protein
MSEIVYIYSIYFGAYLIPIIYLAATFGKGKATKRMIWGVAIHSVWNLVVSGFVYYSWRAGYSEYYWGWALLIPVNIVSGIYYFGALVYSYAPDKPKESCTET